MNEKRRGADPAVEKVLQSAERAGLSTVWERSDAMEPRCGFGELGICCRLCYMGPCRIDPFGDGPQTGVCGATADVIAARNFARMIAGGVAAHSDHGRDVARALLAAVENPKAGYQVKDTAKLLVTAERFGIATKGRSTQEIAKSVAEAALAEFGRQDGELRFLRRAPAARHEVWKRLGCLPRGIDREVVELMHRTTMGVDQDASNIMLQGSRAALSDGWGGSIIATELQDILFGTPSPIRGQVNLGVLSGTKVNIVVHGHEPVLSEMLVLASQDKELLDLAKSKGAEGISLAGICCTANEILLRHGIPIAGNFLQQEMAVATGAVDAMIVDVQCVMASLRDVCKSFHTALITTSPKARMEGVQFIPFSEEDALEAARKIVRAAILNFPNRGHIEVPDERVDLIAGFSHEAIIYMLGGKFRGSYGPLNDNIINGRIKGVAGVVG